MDLVGQQTSDTKGANRHSGLCLQTAVQPTNTRLYTMGFSQEMHDASTYCTRRVKTPAYEVR